MSYPYAAMRPQRAAPSLPFGWGAVSILFFQAEDGIRDLTVTGVQTCALPICRGYSSPLRWASARPAVAGMTQMGLRAIGSARRQEVEAARAYGSHLITAERVHAEGMDAVLATIPKGRAVYVTIDADGLDPADMPGVMAPTPGGLRFPQVAPLLRAIARRNRVVGMDIVEVAPSFALSNGITCVTAGRLILNA